MNNPVILPITLFVALNCLNSSYEKIKPWFGISMFNLENKSLIWLDFDLFSEGVYIFQMFFNKIIALFLEFSYLWFNLKKFLLKLKIY